MPDNKINTKTALNRFIKLIAFFCVLAPAMVAVAQPKGPIIDEIVAIVGDNYILRSDIDKEYATIDEQTDEPVTQETRYEILNSLIAKKILLYKAQLDSVEVTDERLNSEVERRMMYIMSQFPGGEDDFVKYLGKSVEEFKSQIRDKLRQELMIQEMQQKILKDIKITPTDVKKYYNSIPKDSLPYIDAEVTVAQIVRYPIITKEEKEYALRKMERIREEIINGADFELTAKFESDDPSSVRGGELGFFGRGQMVSEFEAAAFKLKPDSISKIIETQYGYHILKLIERRGERVNVRHILIKPKNIAQDLVLAKNVLDTLLESIKAGRISFAQAAKQYSNDEATSANGGKIADHMGNFNVAITVLEKDVFEAVNVMQPGEYFGPKYLKTEDGKDSYKIYHLIATTEPHVANLNDDWLKIQNAALERKKAQALEDWIKKHKKEYYIKVVDKYAEHPLLQHWSKK